MQTQCWSTCTQKGVDVDCHLMVERGTELTK